jgi:MFS transporter, DHA2 family, methylenomycin A resistance protein
MRSVSLQSSAAKPAALPRRSKLAASLTLAAMSLGYGVVQLDVTIVNTALHAIGTSLGGGVAELQWVVSAYTIAFAAFILTAGALGDRIGARSIFMAGFALFTAASLACALAPNAAILIAARCVQGLAAAILVPNSLALLNHAYPDEKARGRAVAVWAAGASLALTAGPFVGGALITLTGWRAIFLVNLPIGLAGLSLAGASPARLRACSSASSTCRARSPRWRPLACLPAR